MKIKLSNGIELKVQSVIQGYEKDLVITFDEGVMYETVRLLYDPHNNPRFSEDVLSVFELYNEEGLLQGKHFGYTEVSNITCFGGVIKVAIKKLDEHEYMTREIYKTLRAVKLQMDI